MVIQMSKYETELRHYGVKGMKWGVKRARKKAHREDPNRSRFSTGKHYDAVLKSYKKDRKPIDEDYNAKASKLVDDVVAYNNRVLAGIKEPKEYERLARENEKINNDYYKKTMALGKKYTDKFNEATLKDIGHEDINRAMDYLKKKDKIIFDFDL